MSLCAEFMGLSELTWHLIEGSLLYSRKSSVGFRETSITDILLISLSRYGRLTGECVVHVPSEIETGADFELVIVAGGWGTHFRIQAKRLYPQRLYKGLNQSTTDKGTNITTYQIDTLCKPRSDFIPFYLFYNWYSSAQSSEEKALLGEGCCLTPALSVRSTLLKLGAPYVGNLPLSKSAHMQVPWSRLVCPSSPGNDLSKHALQQARSMGAIEGEDWGNARRPLIGPYLQLWTEEAFLEDGADMGFARPVVMVGSR